MSRKGVIAWTVAAIVALLFALWLMAVAYSVGGDGLAGLTLCCIACLVGLIARGLTHQ
jgi:hypothetical protein